MTEREKIAGDREVSGGPLLPSFLKIVILIMMMMEEEGGGGGGDGEEKGKRRRRNTELVLCWPPKLQSTGFLIF